MGELTLYISGLALCNFDNRQSVWKIYFPKVGDHIFRIQIRKKIANGDVELSELSVLPESKVVLKAKGVTGGSAKGNVTNALNIDNLILKDPKDRLPLKQSTAADKLYSGYLELHGFSLEGVTVNPDNLSKVINGFNEYEVWDKLPANPPTYPNPYKEKRPNPLKIQNSLKSALITTSDGDTTLIEVSSDQFNGKVEISHSTNSDYTLIINNHCDKTPDMCDQSTDFKFYYNIIDKTKTKDVELIRIPPVGDKGRRVGCDIAITDNI